MIIIPHKEILRQLKLIKSCDRDKSLFYSWENLPRTIQDGFIVWCKKYMQVDHEECFGGWGFGWSKYHEQYILWLRGKRRDLDL